MAKKMAKVAVAPEQIAAATPDVFSNCVALMVHFATFGNRRTIAIDDDMKAALGEQDTAADDAAVDEDMFNLTKALFDRKVLREINRVSGRTKRRLLDTCAVPSFAADGMYLLSTAGVEIAQGILLDEKTHLTAAVEQLIATLDEHKADAQKRLGPRYVEAEYPSATELKAHFGMSWRYLSLGAPAQLQAVSDQFMAEQRAQIEADSKRAAAEIRNLYRASFAELTGHFAEMLKPGDDGKPRRFHPSALEKINTFLTAMPVQNITNDAEIVALGNEAKRILAGVDVGIIKSDDALRAKVQADMAIVTASVQALVKSGRAIDLDDDSPVIMTPGQKAAMTRLRAKQHAA
jgi:hypothetical protein